jgi:hypothetical protein
MGVYLFLKQERDGVYTRTFLLARTFEPELLESFSPGSSPILWFDKEMFGEPKCQEKPGRVSPDFLG